MTFWSFILMFILHEKCQSSGHVKMQNLPCNNPLIFGVFASPWTTVKTEKRKFAFSWEMKSVSGHLKRGAWRDHCFPEPFSWFLHETGLWSLKITSARCFFNIEMSKERLEKIETTPPVSWRPWALATAAIDRMHTTFSCLSAVSKNRRFPSFFFLALGCYLARKSLSWPVSQEILQLGNFAASGMIS